MCLLAEGWEIEGITTDPHAQANITVFSNLMRIHSLKILCTIGGYGSNGADAVTIAAHRTPDGTLAIVKQTEKCILERQEGMALVTNLKLPAYDSLFKEEHLSDAIRSYREMVGQDRLTFSERAMRYKPRIETDGIDEKGQQYRLDPNIDNAQMAILAIVHFVDRQFAITSSASMADRVAKLYAIMSI